MDNIARVLEQRFTAQLHDIHKRLAALSHADSYAVTSELITEEEYVELQQLYNSGESQDIQDTKFAPYLDLLSGAENIVALGCGDGKLIEYCEKKNIKVIGVERNLSQKASYKGKGVIIETDALSFLKNAGQGTFDRLIVRHLIGRIPFNELRHFFDLTYLALQSNGQLIIEYPNPRSIETLLTYYFVDPIHRRPIAPELLSFLLVKAGFDSGKVKFDEINFHKQPVSALGKLDKNTGGDLMVVCQK